MVIAKKFWQLFVDSVYAFCDRFPEAWVYATGSTAARTRLNRMGINKYFYIAEADFEIFGQAQMNGSVTKRVKIIRRLLFNGKPLNLIYEKHS